MARDNQENCNLLTAPISAIALINQGVTLQVNLDYEVSDDLCAEIFDSDNDVGSDDDDVSNNQNKCAQPASPWLKSFDELKEQMLQIDEHIHKRIIVAGDMEKGPIPTEKTRVHIRFHSYWQGESKPFDSSAIQDKQIFSFEAGAGNVLVGFEKAICTMYEGEEAQFVISYKLLFGEMGCPPRIKKRADGLYVIELISYEALNAAASVGAATPTKNRKQFSYVFQKAKELHSKGLIAYNRCKYQTAVKAFLKASNSLEICALANEEDEKQQTNFLIKINTNLAVVYNKLKQPQNTCITCHKIWDLCENRPPCKALFHKGRALCMLGDLNGARSQLIRALKLEPNNLEIKEELKALEKLALRKQEQVESIRQNVAFNPTSNDLPVFKKNMQTILEDFKTNSDKDLVLPLNLNESEIDAINELAKNLDMKLTFSKTEESYLLQKK